LRPTSPVDHEREIVVFRQRVQFERKDRRTAPLLFLCSPAINQADGRRRCLAANGYLRGARAQNPAKPGSDPGFEAAYGQLDLHSLQFAAAMPEPGDTPRHIDGKAQPRQRGRNVGDVKTFEANGSGKLYPKAALADGKLKCNVGRGPPNESVGRTLRRRAVCARTLAVAAQSSGDRGW
jgi:hypothetical protein